MALPEQIPPQTLPLTYQDANGNYVIDMHWYLFLYGLWSQIAAQAAGSAVFDPGVAMAMADTDVAQVSADVAQVSANAAQAAATQALSETSALRAPSYVTLATSATLANERVLTGGTSNNIVITDGGPGSTVTVALTPDITGSALAMTIQPATPDASNSGGILTLQGALASGAGTVGGSVSVIGGDGPTGGFINLGGGNATGTVGDGGDFFMNAGIAGSVSGVPGSMFFAPGYGSGAGGSIRFTSGTNGTNVIHITDNGVSDQMGFFRATPVVQPTTATTSATFVANAGAAVNVASTFDGYKIDQVVKALRNLGLLA